MAVVVCLTAILGAQNSYADDEVDIAVEAFAFGGSLAGVKLGDTEKGLIKSVVRCAVKDRKPLRDCTREALVSRLPAEVQPFAGCMLRGQRIEQCATAQAISQLPPQLHGLANCIADGQNIAQCGKRFGTEQLRQAERAALNEAFEAFDRLKTDAVAANPLAETPSSIQNILRVAEGIRDEEWDKVLFYGGVEFYKIAGKTLMRIFLPAELASLLDPAVDALVQHRVDLFINILKAAKARDEARLGALGFEALVYLHLPLVQACALLPSGKIKEGFCGALAEAVAAIAGLAGKGIELGAGAVEDGYNAAQDLLSGRKDNCGTREQYYDANFSFCRHHAVMAKHLNPGRFAEIEKSLYGACRTHYEPCARRLIGIFETTSERISEICDPVRDRFRREVDELSGSSKDAAATFARSYRPSELKLEHGEDCEARAIQQFIIDCTKALEDRGRLAAASCRVDGRKLGRAFTDSNVCIDAAFVGEGANLRVSFRPVCVFPPIPIEQLPTPVLRAPPQFAKPPPLRLAQPPPPVLPPPSLAPPPPDVVLKPGRPLIVDRIPRIEPPPRDVLNPPGPGVASKFPRPTLEEPPRVPCRDGMVSNAAGGCGCREGTVFRRGRCVRDTATTTPPPQPPPPSVVCQDGTRVPAGSPCPTVRVAEVQCPDGTRARVMALCRKRCPDGKVVLLREPCPAPTPAPCTGDMVGTPPNCRCPEGTSYQRRGPARARCLPIAVATPTPTQPPCRPGMVPKAGGGCGCPQGTVSRYNTCVPSAAPTQCSGNRPVGTYPHCCPRGMRYLAGRCRSAGSTPRPPSQPTCPLTRTCVQWGKGPPGSFAGPCVRYENRPQCPSNVR